MDQAAGKRLLRTDIHEESFDIYEHRMIRTYLESVKKLAGQYRELETRERHTLAGEDVGEQAQKADRRLDALVGTYRELPAAYRRESQLIQLKLRGKPQLLLERDSDGGDKVLAVSSFSAEGQPVLFCEEEYWPDQRQYPKRLTMKAAGNGRQTCFLRRCIDRLTQWWEEHPAAFYVELTGVFDYRPLPYETNRFEIAIRYLDSVRLPNMEFLRFQGFLAGPEAGGDLAQYLKEDLIQSIESGKLSDASDQVFYDASVHSRAVFQRTVLTSDNDWDTIERQAARLLASPLLRGSGTDERLHTSNLFAKHRNYRRAYSLMREKQAQFAGVDLWNAGSLQVGATSSLYEIWCLLKMLSIWINDYSFTLKSPGKDELVAQLLQHLRSSGEEVSTIVLTMERGALEGMELRLDYDKYRCFEENGKTRNLRPDYFLTISYRGRTYRFCMDAKYRNYAPEQQTKAGWYEDIFYVAWFKYILRLRDGGERINESYILHSDTVNRDPVGDQDMGRYFWSRFGKERSENDPDREVRDKSQNGILLHQWIKYSRDQSETVPSRGEALSRLRKQLGQVGDCRFGSICFTPHNDSASDAAFRGLMQMIMEHFLGNDFPEMYQSKCWICGSEDLEVKRLATASGFTKYHIKCKNCKEFWVQNHCYDCSDRETGASKRKLGKHPLNYYRVQSGSVWNVVCPDCGARL